MRTHVLFFLLFFLAWTVTPATAGQLFPPNNLTTDPTACDKGKGRVLQWNNDLGAVECVDTGGQILNLSCPTGSVMKGIVSGTPKCEPIPDCASSNQLLSFNGSGFVCISPQLQGVACGFCEEDHAAGHLLFTTCMGYDPCYGCPAGFSKSETMRADKNYGYSCVRN